MVQEAFVKTGTRKTTILCWTVVVIGGQASFTTFQFIAIKMLNAQQLKIFGLRLEVFEVEMQAAQQLVKMMKKFRLLLKNVIKIKQR